MLALEAAGGYTCRMGIWLYITGGILLCVSAIANVFVRIRLKPRDPDLDEWYYEFEDQHPEVARYDKWIRITFAGICLGILMMFAAVFI